MFVHAIAFHISTPGALAIGWGRGLADQDERWMASCRASQGKRTAGAARISGLQGVSA